MPTEKTIFKCESLPFFTGVQSQAEAPQWQPATLPFELVLPSTGPIHQRQNPLLINTLAEVYRHGSLLSSPPDDNSAYARARLDELQTALHHAVDRVDGLRILEIGCGPGHQLQRLREQGADVSGCEPGPAASIAKETGVNIVAQEFSSALFEPESFDVIYSSMLLEHVTDPMHFTREQLILLKPGGMLFTAVPSCEDLLQSGDPNLPCHEHLSYFTQRSLHTLLAEVGCENVIVESADTTLSLQAWGRKPLSQLAEDSAPEGSLPQNNGWDYEPGAEHYGARLAQRLALLQARVDKLRGCTIGICGVSIGSSVLTGLLDLEGVALQLYDADPAKQGAYLPGVNTPILADEQLAKSVPDELWILPLKAGARIKQKLVDIYQLSPQKVICLSELE